MEFGGIFEIAELQEQLKQITQERDKYKKKWEKADRALQSLTPGGSEYYDDPEYCVKYVRSASEAQHSTIKHFVRKWQKALEQIKSLESSRGCHED